MKSKKLDNRDITALTDSFVQVTEAAAIACFPYIGQQDGIAADAAAVASMRTQLDSLPITASIVIGEGERDEAPMLYIGEKLGRGGMLVDIAVDPLEGTALCAQNKPGAITVLAASPKGGLLHAPDVYMEKIAIGPGLPQNILDLDIGIAENLSRLASAKNGAVSELTVCLLDRPRHQGLIDAARSTGANVQLISDGDVMASLATALPNTGIDMYYGIGGAPEGVLAAAGLKGMDGQMLGRLVFTNKEQEERAISMGCTVGQIYTIEDMVPGNVIFTATGVTSSNMLKGVRILPDGQYEIESLLTVYAGGYDKYEYITRRR